MNAFSYYPFPADSYGYQPNMPGYSPLFEDDFSEADTERMKQLFPEPVRRIQREIEEQCDKLEYEGSCMFDESPDGAHLRMIADIVAVNLESAGQPRPLMREMSFDCRRACGPGRNCPAPCPIYLPDGSPDWRRGLIETMLYREMEHRRRRHHDRRKWF